MINIPIFIINLKHDAEKKAHMQELCDKYSLFPEFIEAVNGKLLSDDFIESIYSKEGSLDSIGRELSKGEIGCALSHKKIYQKMLDENIEKALVLEDDIDFCESLLRYFSEISNFPKRWELVLLGHHSNRSRKELTPYSFWYKKILNNTCTLRRPCEISYGTYGYFINKQGAKRILNEIRKIILPIDHYTGNSKYINLYISEKPIIMINHKLEVKSNLHLEREELKKSMVNKNKSLKRRMSEIFGVYYILRESKVVIIRFISKIKFINSY